MQTGQTERAPTQGVRSVVVSGDGRYLAFAADSADGVFVWDRAGGPIETIVSQGSDPDISTDGRYVVFTSKATDLVSGDTNALPDIFVHDRLTGQSARVNVSLSGLQANQPSTTPSISGDGRVVAFVSSASNLVAGDTNQTSDVFVRDLQAGQIERVSVGSGGLQADAASFSPSISSDGRYVAFTSNAKNLVASDVDAQTDIFVHDRQSHQTYRVSVSPNGPGSGADFPSISADGRYVRVLLTIHRSGEWRYKRIVGHFRS